MFDSGHLHCDNLARDKYVPRLVLAHDTHGLDLLLRCWCCRFEQPSGPLSCCQPPHSQDPTNCSGLLEEEGKAHDLSDMTAAVE